MLIEDLVASPCHLVKVFRDISSIHPCANSPYCDTALAAGDAKVAADFAAASRAELRCPKG